MSMGDEEIKIWLDEYANTIMGNITINLDDSYYHSIGDATFDHNYKDWIYPPPETHDNITLTGGGEEMLRVAKDGFYVRGVKVEADDKEAKQVYEAFKQWLSWANLSRSDEE